jgi:hypothetical protein
LRTTSRTADGSRSSQIRNCSPDAFLLRCPPNDASRWARTRWLSTGRFLLKMNWNFGLAEVDYGAQFE